MLITTRIVVVMEPGAASATREDKRDPARSTPETRLARQQASRHPAQAAECDPTIVRVATVMALPLGPGSGRASRHRKRLRHGSRGVWTGSGGRMATEYRSPAPVSTTLPRTSVPLCPTSRGCGRLGERAFDRWAAPEPAGSGSFAIAHDATKVAAPNQVCGRLFTHSRQAAPQRREPPRMERLAGDAGWWS